MYRKFLTAVVLAACAVPAVSHAQDSAPADLDRRVADAQAAQLTARHMIAAEQRDALAGAAFFELVIEQGINRFGDAYPRFLGPVTVAAPDGTWTSYMVAQTDNGLIEAGWVSGNGEVVDEAMLLPAGSDKPLSGPALLLAQARQTAINTVMDQGVDALCSMPSGDPRAISLRTIALPSSGAKGPVVYVMSGPVEPGEVAMGASYRVSFDPAGEVIEDKALSDSCQVIQWSSDDPNIDRHVFTAPFTLADHPNEWIAYVSAHLPMSMGVITGDLIWPMSGGFSADPVAIDALGSWD